MSKKLSVIVFCLACTLLLSAPAAVRAAGTADSGSETEVSVKKGLRYENGKYYYYKNGVKVKKKWLTSKKKRYYFNGKGTAATGIKTIKKKAYLFSEEGAMLKSSSAKKNQIVTYRDQQYCVSSKGMLQSGWQIIGKKLYYFSKKNYTMQKNRKVSGIKLTKKGYAKTGHTETKLKILTMQIVAKITNDDMSKSAKLRACWNFVVQNSGYMTWRSFNNYKGWEADYAYEFLMHKRGNCYNFAAGFGYLAKEIGYEVYVIRGRVPGSRDGAPDGYTRHSWVTVGGLHYDPEAKFAGWASVYGSAYGTGPITQSNKI